MKFYVKNLALLFAILISLSFSLSENDPNDLNPENGPDSIEELNEKVDSTYVENVILNIQNVMDAYVYSDISQNPPNQGYFSKVNIQEELSKIEIEYLYLKQKQKFISLSTLPQLLCLLLLEKKEKLTLGAMANLCECKPDTIVKDIQGLFC